MRSWRATRNEYRDGSVNGTDFCDDLSREVYCILGMPIDAIGMVSCLRRIRAAAASKVPFLVSTANLNFLTNSGHDFAFRESLFLSDLCTADGVSIVWIARLLGVPIKYRIAGSDIFDALQFERSLKPLNVFLFGGAEGVAVAAGRSLNVKAGGLYCVGSLYPGFGSVEEMSQEDKIDKVNSSNADILVAALGAVKGQLWLLRNHDRLMIPVRAHLGAAINFQSRKVKRAPGILQKLGLEWLWRIKEEPHLWRRYLNDGRVLLWLLLTRIVPLAIWMWRQQFSSKREGQGVIVMPVSDGEFVMVSLSGCATAKYVDNFIAVFREALTFKKDVIIDFSNICAVDARFIGLLLMLRKVLRGQNRGAICKGMSPSVTKIMQLHGVEFMLSAEKTGDPDSELLSGVVALPSRNRTSVRSEQHPTTERV
jgi:N-acetylglucosaminyldiphosphoundecaprenol N-acetyl-beta-D-mannosaminyltransferase